MNVKVFEAAACGVGEFRNALDRIDPAARTHELGEDCGLVAGAGADLQHTHAGPKLQFLGHDSDHEGLRDGLPRGDRQRLILIGVSGLFTRNKKMARDGAHRLKDRMHHDAAAAELMFHHCIAAGGVGIGCGFRCGIDGFAAEHD